VAVEVAVVAAGRVIVVVTWWIVVEPQPAIASADIQSAATGRALKLIDAWWHGRTLQAMLYRLIYRHLLGRLDPEVVHTRTARTLAVLGRLPGFHALLRGLAGRPDPCLEVEAFGHHFPSPLGVAAGLDKNVDWCAELGALGFGYVEVGTITAEPQPGNPRPRIHRLPADRALLNSMGFPGDGAAAAQRRLRDRRDPTLVAVNVGRTKTATDTRADYRSSVRQLAPHADMLVLNVSSPNTPGLRDLQAVDQLRELVGDVRSELAALGVAVALLVKIAPDLDDDAIDALAIAALELRLDGLVCTNTTVSRSGLSSPAQLTDLPGGISGAPLKARSLAVLRRVRAQVGDRLVLVSVGGIETADDALARIRAGATLLQAYTGFVYGGPGWPGQINRGLADRVHAYGVTSITELIATEPTL
jgi:dihydroorotate dehydrogenase